MPNRAYCTPGRLTGGMDFWLLSQKRDGDKLEAEIRLTGHHGKTTLLYVPEKAGPYRIPYRGETADFQESDGVLELIRPGNLEGTLVVEGR